MPGVQKTAALLLVASAMLGGCGTNVPNISEAYDQPNGRRDADADLEVKIKSQVYCELKKAVYFASNDKSLLFIRDNVIIPALPSSWGVQVTLSLQVDETGALNPGVTLNTPFAAAISSFPGAVSVATSQIFNLGLGGTLSSQATRMDKFNFYYDIDLLKRYVGKGDPCFFADDGGAPEKKHGSSFLLESDLGLVRWLHDALVVENTYRSTPLGKNADASFKQDALTYEVRFLVVTSGNVTPTWRLVRVSANTGSSPLVSLNRTRTHDLIVTFGPSDKPNGKGPSQPGLVASYAQLSSQIGLAIGSNMRGGAAQ